MKPLTQVAHDLIRTHLPASADGAGLLAIDATAGNGHDTRFLAELVGPAGRVWAVDIQTAAIERTRERLGELKERVDLQLADHADLDRVIPSFAHGQIAVCMLNLGYLPGGQKTEITEIASTLSALRICQNCLCEGGLLSVLAYPGHPGGYEETLAVEHWLTGRTELWESIARPNPDLSLTSPRLWLVRKSRTLDSSLRPE